MRPDPVYPASAVYWRRHNTSQTPERKITTSKRWAHLQMLSLSSKRGEQTDLPDGGAHQRHHHDYDVVVEIKVWQSYQEVTDTPDGHFSQTFITLKRHGLTSLLLLLLPVWNSIRSDDGEENERADGKVRAQSTWCTFDCLFQIFQVKLILADETLLKLPQLQRLFFHLKNRTFKWVTWYIYFLLFNISP